MLSCPRCGEQAFSAWTKLVIGPATSARCRHCLKPVSVSWMSVGLLALFFVAMIGLRLLMRASPVYWTIVAFLAAGCLFVHVKWVPLEKR